MDTTKYDISTVVLYKRLLPWFYKKVAETNLLKPKANALFEVIGGSLTTPKDAMYTLMQQIKSLLSYTGQTMSLQYGLNEVFDNTLNGITITDNNVLPIATYNFYKETEIDPLPKNIYKQGETDLVPKTLYKESEIGASNYHFTINVPNWVTATDTQILAFVRIYAIAMKNYNIVRI